MIRPARAEDLPALIPIYDAARRFMAEHGNPTQWAASGYPNGEDLAEDIRLGQLYVLDEGGALHGAFVLQLGEEANYRQIDGAWLSDAPYGTIHRVASDGAVPGLFDACLAFCRDKIAHLRIDTHENNAVMRHLIVSRGFLPCGVIRVEDGTLRLAFERVEQGLPCASGAGPGPARDTQQNKS